MKSLFLSFRILSFCDPKLRLFSWSNDYFAENKNLFVETPYLDTISGDDGLVRVGVWWTGGQHVESNFLGFKNNPRCFLTKIDVYHRAEFPATFDINSRIQVSTKVQNWFWSVFQCKIRVTRVKADFFVHCFICQKIGSCKMLSDVCAGCNQTRLLFE